jgi:hypothetical protein
VAANCDAWQTPYLNAQAADNVREMGEEEAEASRVGGSAALEPLEQVAMPRACLAVPRACLAVPRACRDRATSPRHATALPPLPPCVRACRSCAFL